jgi:hypothetical protein
MGRQSGVIGGVSIRLHATGLPIHRASSPLVRPAIFAIWRELARLDSPLSKPSSSPSCRLGGRGRRRRRRPQATRGGGAAAALDPVEPGFGRAPRGGTCAAELRTAERCRIVRACPGWWLRMNTPSSVKLRVLLSAGRRYIGWRRTGGKDGKRMKLSRGVVLAGHENCRRLLLCLRRARPVSP